MYTFAKGDGNVNRVKALRTASGMKQTELAQLLNCTAMTVSRYETGSRDIDSATICRLCEIFGCTADYLLGRSDLRSAELTPEEEQLLAAFRRGDDRARDIVRVALEPFSEDARGESAI